MWIFDSSDGEARLLRFRSGHSAPPTCIQYYGNGRHILSAGQDRAFRVFSTIQDQQSRELSQGHVSKRARKLKLKEEDVKLAPVIAFAAAEIRERDWCNVVTCHMDDKAAYTWRLQNFVIGEHVLKPCPQDPSPVKACTISTCGNFAILGTEKGYVERFNLQSGISRGCYVDVSDENSRAHIGALVGLAADSSNTSLLSGGYDGFIKVWDFKRCDLKSVLEVGFPLLKMAYHSGNGLLATAADDMSLRLYDVVALRLVRLFQGHTDRITDICFSEDGKWLLSAAMDRSVRVWDVIASKPLHAMHVDAAVTSLSLSPSMDMLATSHVNHNGIYLWANRLIYSGLDKPELCGSGNVVVNVHMPTVAVKRESLQEDLPGTTSDDFESKSEMVSVEDVASRSQITPELVTLSLLPKTQWQGLVNIDIIKSRNKPVVPPKKPERAPFFLPTLPSVSGDVVFSSESNGIVRSDTKLQKKFISQANHLELTLKSDFTRILYKCSQQGDYTEFVEFAKSMSPSALDAELRILQIVDEDEFAEDARSPQIDDINLLMEFLLEGIASNNNFEFLQAFLQIFLKIHGEAISRLPSLKAKSKMLCSRQNSTWQRLDEMFQNIRCMVSFLSNTQF
ncbi:hypothetical protein O6H91_Y267700 [Diphasiastrum complanatum]|nr:hypothetical protein O6H91_Y267700 [Diphasiastrum complanatum]